MRQDGRVHDIDVALERLLTAYAAAGGTMNDADPASPRELQALRKMVAPLRVPDELEVLWRRFQTEGPPGILDTQSLETLEVAVGAARYSALSRALLVIGAGAGTLCYIELHDARGTGGGGVWTLEEFGSEVHEVAPSLAALLGAVAIAWERGIVRLSEHHPFPWAAWDEPAWEHLKAEVLPAGRKAGARPSGWLERWLEAEGLTAADVAPHGSTATIARLLARGDAWTGAETIRGRVRFVAGNPDFAAVTIDDGSGDMSVYVPP